MAEDNNTGEIVYEQPINELTRACLRLEYLFQQLDHCLEYQGVEKYTAVIVRYVMDILTVLDRPDLKSKLTTNLHQYNTILSGYHAANNEQKKISDSKLKQIQDLSQYFLASSGKLGQSLRQNQFIATIQQHFLYPGDCCIDAPQYHYWLHQPVTQRQQRIQKWLHELNNIRTTVELLLEITRSRSEFQLLAADNGFYHCNLDAESAWQMARIRITSDQAVYPEISVGRHRVSVRFIIADMDSPAHQSNEPVRFELSCCAI